MHGFELRRKISLQHIVLLRSVYCLPRVSNPRPGLTGMSQAERCVLPVLAEDILLRLPNCLPIPPSRIALRCMGNEASPRGRGCMGGDDFSNLVTIYGNSSTVHSGGTSAGVSKRRSAAVVVCRSFAAWSPLLGVKRYRDVACGAVV